MINTSIAFRRALSGNREFRIKDTITLKNKKEIPIPMMDLREYKINEATSASGKFEIGAAVIKEYKVALDNSEEQYDDCDFEGANIQAVIGLKLADGTWEDLKKGVYRVYTATFGETTLQITAYDEMIYFDRPYSECTLSYPATVRDIVLDACRHCQVDCESGSIEMGNYIVKTKPEGSITYRDVISYCAQIMGCYARINHLGRLAFGWYDFSAVGSGDLDGGIFDTASQEKYLSGDEADGGTFDDYSSGYTYDGGTFVDMDTYHHFYDLYNKSINGTDINITGIQITAKKDSADEKYLYGTNTYALEIKDNPLIQTDTMQQVAKHIGNKIINKPFRPMSISIQGNPAIEAGDVVVVSPKTTSSYTTVITDTTFSLFAAQSISSTAETPTAKTFTRYGAATKLLEAARNYTDQEMSAYDLVVQQMSQLAANTLGFHETKIIQDDGSVIVYRHDKPKLSESKIVYKSGIDGFFVTRSYTGKDSTTVWKAGFDSNGNAALNILSVIGIHWDWGYGGTLTLGGEDNKNGVLRILNANGAQIGKWDNTGADITGTVKTISSEGVYAKMAGQDIVFVNGNNDIDEQILMRIGATISTDDNFADINLGENTNFGIGGNGREILQIYPYDNWTTKILGNFEVISGTKSRIAETENFSDRLLYCYETPTPMFGDVGCAQTNAEGVSIIDIDPVFAETISTGTEYQVFLQKEGPGDLWIQEKDESYFVVRGTPELKFSWELKCSQKHFEHLRLEEETQRTMVSKDINNVENDYSDIIDGLVNDYDTEMEELINESN